MLRTLVVVISLSIYVMGGLLQPSIPHNLLNLYTIVVGALIFISLVSGIRSVK